MAISLGELLEAITGPDHPDGARCRIDLGDLNYPDRQFMVLPTSPNFTGPTFVIRDLDYNPVPEAENNDTYFEAGELLYFNNPEELMRQPDIATPSYLWKHNVKAGAHKFAINNGPVT